MTAFQNPAVLIIDAHSYLNDLATAVTIAGTADDNGTLQDSLVYLWYMGCFRFFSLYEPERPIVFLKECN